jgi:hypothetical protein
VLISGPPLLTQPEVSAMFLLAPAGVYDLRHIARPGIRVYDVSTLSGWIEVGDDLCHTGKDYDQVGLPVDGEEGFVATIVPSRERVITSA